MQLFTFQRFRECASVCCENTTLSQNKIAIESRDAKSACPVHPPMGNASDFADLSGAGVSYHRRDSPWTVEPSRKGTVCTRCYSYPARCGPSAPGDWWGNCRLQRTTVEPATTLLDLMRGTSQHTRVLRCTWITDFTRGFPQDLLVRH